MNIWNALLVQACKEPVLTVDKQMIEINKAANKYKDLMQPIDSTGGTYSIGATIWNLSELPNCVCMDFSRIVKIYSHSLKTRYCMPRSNTYHSQQNEYTDQEVHRYEARRRHVRTLVFGEIGKCQLNTRSEQDSPASWSISTKDRSSWKVAAGLRHHL